MKFPTRKAEMKDRTTLRSIKPCADHKYLDYEECDKCADKLIEKLVNRERNIVAKFINNLKITYVND